MVQSANRPSKFEGVVIAYVDDERDNLTSFEMQVEGRFDVLTFEDPVAGLEYCKQHPEIAVFLLDQVMPGLSGIEFARAIKKVRPTSVCLMITGNGTKQLAVEAIREGVFTDFIDKPVDFGSSEMRQKLSSAIQEHLLEQTKVDYRHGTLELLADLIDDKDGHTHQHSRRVTAWALKVASKLNLSEREMVMVREGAMIHDIGKISIPDDILKKPGRLTPLERRIIQTHTTRGGSIVEKIPQLKQLTSIVRDHHERPDGQGYPNGLKGDQIPLLTSIVAIADFFEALSSKRPYKDPWSVRDIVKEIAANRGRQFCDQVVDALFAVIAEEGLMELEELQEVVAVEAA